MHQRFSENLYLTTGKLTIFSAARAMRYMRRFVAKWRENKARRLREGVPAPGQAPNAGGPAASIVAAICPPGQKTTSFDDPMAC